MALDVRKLEAAMTFAVVQELNTLRRSITEDLTSYPHADTTSYPSGLDYRAPACSPKLVTAADASSLATLRTLCRDLWVVATAHFLDVVAHKAADGTNDFGSQPATDASLGTLQTWLNAAKAAFNGHVDEAGVHFTNDGTYSITSPDASDQSSANTLANELKGDLNDHLRFALAGNSINLVPA